MTTPKAVQELIAQAQRVPGVTSVFIYDLPEGKQATFWNGSSDKYLECEGGFFKVAHRECFTLKLVWMPIKDEGDDV